MRCLGGRLIAAERLRPREWCWSPFSRKILRNRSFFVRQPPKTAGREEFGREFVREFLRAVRAPRKEDVVATATALTARSIADAVRRFVVKQSGSSAKTSFARDDSFRRRREMPLWSRMLAR